MNKVRNGRQSWENSDDNLSVSVRKIVTTVD